ncbi:MAG: hypothetical protein NUW01_00395 [Gemmatimonadaceae bacterium]|nr:hypothetical protein [Gemmatimonadaceae bacterium]
MASTLPGYDSLTGMPTKKKQPWQTALGQRSTGLNQQYGLGQYASPSGGGGLGGGQQLGPINLPGFTPDYKSLISQALGPLSAQLTAEGSADVASRNAGLIRGMAQFGEQFDPAGAQAAFGQDFYNQAGMGDILGQANALAAENTKAGFSVKARQQSAFEKSVQQIRDALASRGMLRSGATGIALQGAQKEFDTGSYDARMQLSDYMSGVQQGLVNAQRQRAGQLEAAQREEAERQARLNPPTGSRTVNPGDPDYPVTPTPVTPPTPPPAPAAAPDIASNVPQSIMSQRTGGEAGGSAQLQAILAALHRASQNQRLGF